MRYMVSLCCVFSLCACTAWASNLSNHLEQPKDSSHVGKNFAIDGREGGETIIDALPIPGIPYFDIGATCDNINDYDEICPYSGSTSPDVVYFYNPPDDIHIDIDLCGSLYDTKVYVYDDGLNLLACNDDFYFDEVCGIYVSRLEDVPLWGGTTYYIVVDGYGGDCGEYQIEVIEFEPEPPCELECPPIAELEDEPPLVDGYLDEWNGGCNSTPPVFQWLYGQGGNHLDFCGVSGWYTFDGYSYRDTDWFEVVATGTSITVTIDAELHVNLFQLSIPDCNYPSILQSLTVDPCFPGTMYIYCTPGEIVHLWVGSIYVIPPDGFVGNEFDYTLSIDGIEDGVVLPGTIVIDPNPDSLNAPWVLTGPDGFFYAGTGDETLTNMDPGDYTLHWNGVPGWIVPFPNPGEQYLSPGGEITFSGAYTPEVPQAADIVCIYFDYPACTQNNLPPGFFGIYPAYVVLQNPSATGGVFGFEFSLCDQGGGFNPPPGSIIPLNYNLPPGAINALTPPEFAVGVAAPLPWETNVLLLTVDFLIVAPESWSFGVQPIYNPTIPDHMLYVDGADPANLILMHPCTGDVWNSCEMACINCDPLPYGATIVVDPNPDSLNAPWVLSGPTAMAGNGDATLSVLPGEYTLTWGHVGGWATPYPNPVTQSVTFQETITFSGTYEQTTGTIVIDPEPDGLSAPWTLEGPAGPFVGNGDETLTDMEVGTYTLTWGDVGGWYTPEPNPAYQTLSGGDTITFAGTYAEVPGGDFIGLYSDPGGTNCFLYDLAPGLCAVYVVHTSPAGALGCQFSAPQPPEWLGAVWLSDSHIFPVNIGNSQDGIQIAYGNCLSGPIHVLTIIYFCQGYSPPCVPYPVLPDPAADSGQIQVIDCASNVQYASGGVAMINGNEYDCPCNELTTTGTVVINPEPDELNAPWDITGPVGYVGSGTGNATFLGMLSGEYTLTWGDVSGWITPDPNPVTYNLLGGNSISFNGLYVPSPAWVDVTSGALGSAAAGAGVAWGDCDTDVNLYYDLYLVNESQANLLFHNLGGALFNDITADPVGHGGPGTGAYWGDYDNDGDPDLYLLNAGAANALFRNLGGCTFADATVGELGDPGNAWGGAWVDYDNDGFIDLYVSNEGQPNLLLKNNNGLFTDQTPEILSFPGNSQGVAWGDYDNDGDQDLYLVVGADPNRLFRNDGAGQFVDVTPELLAHPGSGQGAAWGDYDNDEDLDLYITNWGDANALYRNEGGGVFSQVASPLLANRGFSQSAVWGDYDNDGYLDLYLANYGQPNKLFRNVGDGTFIDETNPVLADEGNGVGVAWADMDNDGDLDLYLANAGSANKLLQNNIGTDNHWLHIKLVGTLSNRSAIGARVRIVSSGLHQIREVTAGSGYLSQNSLLVEFGLGSATSVETLQVIWPRRLGQGQYHTTLLTDVPADQILEITELDDPLAGVDDFEEIPTSVVLHQCYPNPFNPMTTISFELPRSSAVNLQIYSASGQLIRDLVKAEVFEAGRHEVVWLGDSNQGQKVASGVYFCRLSTGNSVETTRMVLVK